MNRPHARFLKIRNEAVGELHQAHDEYRATMRRTIGAGHAATEHGAEAEAVVNERINEASEANDTARLIVWRAVAEKIDRMRDERPAPGASCTNLDRALRRHVRWQCPASAS